MSAARTAHVAAAARAPTVAIAGNPNTGKTTLFNRLTGSDQKVGNYPGVTVESHRGATRLPSGRRVEILDVPGAYSLSARSREEEIAVRAIAGIPPLSAPDLIVVVVDATQLARNLYFALQTIELDVPIVIALNMSDMLAKRRLSIADDELRAQLGVPVVSISALHGRGLEELRAEIDRVLDAPERARATPRWQPTSEALIDDVAATASALPVEWKATGAARTHALALWALLSLDDEDELFDIPSDLRAVVSRRRAIAESQGRSIELEVIRGRYDWIDERMPRFVRESGIQGRTTSERVDALLLNPALGFAVFLLVMALVFESLFTWSEPAIGAIESVFSALSMQLGRLLPSGLLLEFLRDGLIAGVGSVVVFLPQILLLFFFIGLMEDTGYMARVAFLMDRIMKSFGLHGRAFVPMLSGYACAVPAILATRTMERQRDRTLTMMVIPLMTCSARLPVYALVIAALFPTGQWLGFLSVSGALMIGMYLFSTLTALAAAFVLSRTLFRAPTVPLILELPPYRMPHWPSVLRMMWQRSRMFLKEAGGVILVCTVALWLLLSFPRDAALKQRYDDARAAASVQSLDDDARAQRQGELDAEEAGERLRHSYGGRLGQLIEPAIAPLGFDWKIGIGLIGAFAAREVFVSTMGVVYGVGDSVDEESATLRDKIRAEAHADGRPVYSPLAGLSLMVFFALACQCMSTLAAVRRETRTWKWPIFLFVYMTVLAWGASFVVYQGGRLLGFS
ncbi:MAG: ferrous iron transport protein B [Planctomycetota bacterium]